MQPPEKREEALARSVRRMLRHAAKEIVFGRGTTLDRLVTAWPHLRPLFPNAVPGQAGLSMDQRRELQWILDTMGSYRGAGANSTVIRLLAFRDAEKVATRIRWLASTLPADPETSATTVTASTSRT